MHGPERRTRIAVDAMGSDTGPSVIVRGAIEALEAAGQELCILLVGDEPAIWHELRAQGAGPLPLFVIHARQQVEMGEQARRAFRDKPESSIAVCVGLVREGRADAMVSTGNTGAVVTTALLNLGRMRGVERPAIATIIPTAQGRCVVLDGGANADCRPSHLYQFAHMGRIYAEHALGVPNPRVGLLNIGEEPCKGNAVTQAAYQLLDSARDSVNFIGNVEGRDILAGRADVVVCDGFTGNVILKLAESLASVGKQMISEEVKRNPFYSLAALAMKPVFSGVARRMNYEEYGGALLLGTRGVCVIGHGRSTPRAIRNAILTGLRSARTNPESLLWQALGPRTTGAAAGS